MTRSQWREQEGRVFQPEGTKGAKVLYVRSRNAREARTQRMQNIRKCKEYSTAMRPFGGTCVGRSGRQVLQYSNSSLWVLMLILWSPDAKS